VRWTGQRALHTERKIPLPRWGISSHSDTSKRWWW
jgi:hypothetical protein